MATAPDLASIWSAAGVIAGFQTAAFTWRLSRELKIAAEGDRNWFPVADLLNLGALAVNLLGVFVLPAIDVFGAAVARLFFGWATLLLAMWPVAILGHYEMLSGKPRTKPARYLPRQEWLAVSLALLLSGVYWAVAAGT